MVYGRSTQALSETTQVFTSEVIDMSKEQIIQKLTSRKLWVAVCNFISNIMIAYGMSENQIAQVVAIIMAGAGVVAYIIGEGLVDSNRESNSSTDTSEEVLDAPVEDTEEAESTLGVDAEGGAVEEVIEEATEDENVVEGANG